MWKMACEVEQRVRGGTNQLPTQVTAVPGKTLAGSETLNQYSWTEKYVWSGLMLNCWLTEGCTGNIEKQFPVLSAWQKSFVDFQS